MKLVEDIKKAMVMLGFNEDDTLDVKDLRKAFKKKSIAMLPEKHPTVPNAHSRFEEIITAFVQVGVSCGGGGAGGEFHENNTSRNSAFWLK